MKKQIIAFILTLVPLISYSQEYEYISFPDSGVIWSEAYQPPFRHGVFPPPIYERFALSGEDTIIDEITYNKLYVFYDTVFNKNNATCVGGIREDEQKKIYFKGDSIVHDFKPMNFLYNYEEILLYDFSVNVGDTIMNINCNPEDDRLVVSAIDTILINNTLRKRISFDPMPWVKWIEGIGNIKGLLFTSGDIPTNGLNNYLICFKQNGEILYFNNEFSECFPLISNIETNTCNNYGIKLFPNPSGNSKITFDFGKQNNDIDNIQILDCNGRIIEDYEVNMQSTYILSTEKYQPGIYFYKATNIKGIEHTGKFVVQ